MSESNQFIIERLKIGNIGLVQSLGVWGLMVLVVVAFALAIVASITGQNRAWVLICSLRELAQLPMVRRALFSCEVLKASNSPSNTSYSN